MLCYAVGRMTPGKWLPPTVQPPRNIFDQRRRRYRASFFFLLAIVATLLVQAFFGRTSP